MRYQSVKICAGRVRKNGPVNRSWLLFALLYLLAAGFAQAQDYPNRPIRVIIPFAAGNTGDISFRIIAPSLEARIGQRFVIENRAGASGIIGAQEVARSAPNGYTLLLGATSIFIANQFMYKAASSPPLALYDPVALIFDAPQLVVVRADLPVSNLQEFQAYTKKFPGKLNFSSPGLGTLPHLSGVIFADLAEIDMVHIPYKGSSAAALALLSDDVQLYFSVLSAVEGNLRSGHLKALAVTSQQRMAAFPNVPTTAESGFSDLLAGAWWGLAAPKGTDPRIIDKLATAIRATLSEPGVVSRFASLGMIPGDHSPAELASKIQAETAKLKRVIDKLGIRPE